MMQWISENLGAILTNLGTVAASLLGLYFVIVKIYKSVKQDRAEGAMSDGANTLISGLSAQYQLFADSNKLLNAELLDLRRNNLNLQSECDKLRLTVQSLHAENAQLMDSVKKLQVENEKLHAEFAKLKETFAKFSK